MASCPNCHQPIAESERACRFCSFILLAAGSVDAIPASTPGVDVNAAHFAKAPKTAESTTGTVGVAKGRRVGMIAVAAVAVIGSIAMLALKQPAPQEPNTATPAAGSIAHAPAMMQTVTIPGVSATTEYTSQTATAVEPKWTTGRERVWGRSNVKFELLADGDVPVWKKTIRPVLTVRCLGNKTEVFVMTFSPASVEQSGSMHTVSVRFDEAPAQTQQWEHSDDHSALFAEDGVALARQIASAGKMTFEFSPFNAPPVSAEFNVAGFETHLKAVAKTCSWK